MIFLLKSLISMNDFQEKKHQLKQIDFCCLRLLQLGNIAKVRLWTAQMSFKRLKLVFITKIYFMLWIGLDIMVGSKFIKPIFLNWFMILNLKKYESICLNRMAKYTVFGSMIHNSWQRLNTTNCFLLFNIFANYVIPQFVSSFEYFFPKFLEPFNSQ